MKLNRAGYHQKADWEGYILPSYDIERMTEKTREAPVWVHFGPGNIFRAYQAILAEELLEKGLSETGIIVAGSRDTITSTYRAHDNLVLSVTLKGNGDIEKRVAAAVAESVVFDAEDAAEWLRLQEIFAAKSLQLVTFTITEKGYSLSDQNGALRRDVARDYENGPKQPESFFGKIAALLHHRYLSSAASLALLSNDNCSHNGEVLKKAVMAYVDKWVKNGLCEMGFKEYVMRQISFPWSMIDKITPRPDDSIRDMLKKDGLEDTETLITGRNTFTSVFVNAEEVGYLVVEDDFPNGRPALEETGVIFTDRDTVDKVERMKVGTCLNPLHTALAVFGCLLDYHKISDEMRDPDLKALVKNIGYKEGLKVVEDPGVLDPQTFMDTCLNERFPNPYVPDTPQRIASDTSQKIPVRYGVTYRKYVELNRQDTLRFIPFVFAGWIRYLLETDDNGNPFTISPDPLGDKLKTVVQGASKDDLYEALKPILSDGSIFGADLYETGVAERVIGYYKEMCQGKGAIRKAIEKINLEEGIS